MSDLPGPVAAALMEAGWHAGRTDEARARAWGLRLGSDPSLRGRAHAFFPAALAALARFGGVRVEPVGEGEDVAPSGFALDPLLALHTVETLAALATRIGAPLTPLGVELGGGSPENAVAVLAIDERGRVFTLDHTGEWFLGESIEAALSTLVLGRLPARIRADGGWE
jgi:hypothetical protein